MVLLTFKKEVLEMLRKRIIAVIVGIALMIAVTGVSGIVADSLGLSMTPPVSACDQGAGSGGGC